MAPMNVDFWEVWVKESLDLRSDVVVEVTCYEVVWAIRV